MQQPFTSGLKNLVDHMKDSKPERYPEPPVLTYKGKWVANWFSNMEPCNLSIEDYYWPSVENYYQFKKIYTDDLKFWTNALHTFQKVTPSAAKRLGKQIKMNAEDLEDWNAHDKYLAMGRALIAKWVNIPMYRNMLKATILPIVEYNNWGDNEWGVDISKLEGRNVLGRGLSYIRDHLLT